MNRESRNQIINKTKEFVLNDGKIKMFYFLPWFVLAVFFTFTLFYQIVYTYVMVFWDSHKVMVLLLDVLQTNYVKYLIIPILIFFFLYIIVFPIYEAGLIWYVSKKYTPETGDDLSRSDALSNWLYRFLPFFEHSNIFSQFKIVNLLNFFLFFFRFMWVDYFMFLLWVFSFLLILFIIMNILFIYSKYEVVLNNQTALNAIEKSVKMTIINLIDTIWFYFYMFVLDIKVILNFFVFLLFPVLITAAFLFISSAFIKVLSIILLVIAFVLLILFLWYTTWVLEVYKTMLWYHLYAESKKKLDAVAPKK